MPMELAQLPPILMSAQAGLDTFHILLEGLYAVEGGNDEDNTYFQYIGYPELDALEDALIIRLLDTDPDTGAAEVTVPLNTVTRLIVM